MDLRRHHLQQLLHHHLLKQVELTSHHHLPGTLEDLHLHLQETLVALDQLHLAWFKLRVALGLLLPRTPQEITFRKIKPTK